MYCKGRRWLRGGAIKEESGSSHDRGMAVEKKQPARVRGGRYGHRSTERLSTRGGTRMRANERIRKGTTGATLTALPKTYRPGEAKVPATDPGVRPVTQSATRVTTGPGNIAGSGGIEGKREKPKSRSRIGRLQETRSRTPRERPQKNIPVAGPVAQTSRTTNQEKDGKGYDKKSAGGDIWEGLGSARAEPLREKRRSA